MHTMTTDDRQIHGHPEYARAYQHYLRHGQAPEQAARLAWDHTRQHLAAQPVKAPNFGQRHPVLLPLLIAGPVILVLLLAVSLAPEQPTQDTATTQETPTAASVSPTPAAPTTPAAPPPPPKPVIYAKLTARQWQLIAKNPDAYAGKAYIVYGVVTQFDAATGTEGFRASVDGVRRWNAYDYETNTVLTADPAIVRNVVQDDMFTAKVVVDGSYSYDTQLGGNTTVPSLSVVTITVLPR